VARPTDIPLEPPLVSGRTIVRAVEDRTYLGFIAAALLSALAGGFLLAIWMPLAATGDAAGSSRTPWLIQSHGWLQLQGWAGMFVAGMAVRIIPRFAGRKPIGRRITIPLLAFLTGAVLTRGIFQPWAEGDTARFASIVVAVLSAAGCSGVSALLAWTLLNARKTADPWLLFAAAGTVWWAAWAVMMLVVTPENGFGIGEGLLAARENDAFLWVVMLGPIGNFIWGVQSRSVPIFFGRKTPSWRMAGIPGAMLNAAAVLLAVSIFLEGDAAEKAARGGLALAGLALIWLPLVAGAVWGKAKRLRPRAKPASRFVLAANISAVVAGVLLLYAGLQGLLGSAEQEFLARDAARHAYGIGLITMLIIGMARLIAPVFALERTESGVPRLFERAPFWLLLAAVVLRVGSALLGEQSGFTSRMHSASVAGVLAWLAIAIFALSVVRAARAAPGTMAALEASARGGA